MYKKKGWVKVSIGGKTELKEVEEIRMTIEEANEHLANLRRGGN